MHDGSWFDLSVGDLEARPTMESSPGAEERLRCVPIPCAEGSHKALGVRSGRRTSPAAAKRLRSAQNILRSNGWYFGVFSIVWSTTSAASRFTHELQREASREATEPGLGCRAGAGSR